MSTYTPIATQTLSASAQSVTFSSIPQGYTDLVLVVSAKNTVGQNYETWLRFNSDTTSSYSQTFLQNYANSTQAGRNANITEIRCGKMNTTSFDTNIVHINNYSNNTTYKTTLSRHNNAEFVTGAMAGTWRKTSAITTIDVICETGANYTAGSTFSLYGIAVGNSSAKADGGNIVVNTGGYIYHAYTSSGSFIPNQSLSADILVVGAGGGGGAFHGGGGGGGAIEGSAFFQTQTLNTNSYTVVIGAGGRGGAIGGRGNNGSSSLFIGSSTITALGGGGGGSAYVVPSAGGSGGGTGQSGHSAGAASGSNTNAGGISGGNGQGGGGGGGATAAGSNASNNTAGAGGQGKTLTTIDSNFTALGFASIVASSGGGGGSEGGSAAGGGTGAGSGTNNDTAGGNATSFGSGGGGGGYAGAAPGYGGNGGNGYSGLVIIRYAV
jgi:hypothetical protein